MSLIPFTSDLLETPGVTHGFFTRLGGVSEGVYASLNCGPGSNDDPENVRENRDRVARFLVGENRPINTLYQIHSSTLAHLDKPFRPGERTKADALITKTKGVILGVLTADCAPILFSDPKAGIIAAAHAGWRGAFDEIIENVVANMVHMGSKPGDIRAVIGPCIGRESYEVQADFRASFLKRRRDNQQYFKPGENGRFLFDLQQFCLDHLRESGLTKIEALNLDTYRLEEKFFSFRRTTHRGEADYGRQVSVIVLA